LAIIAALAGAAGSWPMGAAAPPVASRPATNPPAAPTTASAQSRQPAVPEFVLAPSPQTPPLRAVELDAYTAAAAKKAYTTPLTPRQIARRLLRSFHWRPALQFPYLNLLWIRESNWNVRALNGSSGAYGIPQATPAVKMAGAGPDWRTDARTQILWGLRYIQARYGNPLLAWEHEITVGWY
jgi:hypothetical protein